VPPGTGDGREGVPLHDAQLARDVEPGGVKIRPVGPQVLVIRMAKPEELDRLIVTPAMARTKSVYGIVEAVGPGERGRKDPRKRHPISVAPGDKVVMQEHAGKDLRIQGMDHVLLHELNILAVIERSEGDANGDQEEEQEGRGEQGATGA
jgi:chaperonin GroES